MRAQPEPQLAARQRRFFELLCDGRPLDEVLAARAGRDPAAVPVQSWLAATSESDARRRLDIYRGMRAYRLTDALREDFRSVHAALGDARFTELASAYVATHPSHSPSLREFGAGLPAFVRRTPQSGARADLADLCALDWARLSMFDARDVQPLDTVTIAALPPSDWERFRVRAIPAHTFVDSAHAIERVWLALDRGEPVPEAQSVPQTFLVWKLGFEVRHTTVVAPEREALAAAAGGLSLAALCERLAIGSSSEHAAAPVFATLRRWLTDGVLCEEAALP